ncbi:MAG: HEAT repeat domain-containing protein [Planctomycetota bacterium]|nr:HEAT repeat domain-containing protein [Planctomycetota bacterium]
MWRLPCTILLALTATLDARGQQVAPDSGRELWRQAKLWENGKLSADELSPFIEAAAKRPSAASTEALLHLASTGMDGRPVRPELSAAQVRARAERSLGALDEVEVLDGLIAAASTSQPDVGIRVAAVRALGRANRPVIRVFVEAHLGDRQRLVRLAAAEALALRAHPGSLDDLAARLDAEDDALVLHAIARTTHHVLKQAGGRADPGAALRATTAAIQAIGRTDDWRTDLALVEMLGEVRTARSIPTLIDVLDRCRRANDRRSQALRDRTAEVLCSLTGTRLAPDDVAGWRRFWDEHGSGFSVAPRVERREDAGATSAGFFGIAIRGSHVAFLIDVSGSMKATLAPLPTSERTSARDASGEPASRLDWAKHELEGAVRELPGDARFVVIPFSGRAARWNDRFVPATPQVRAALHAMLGGLGAQGGTNVWGALDAALNLSDARFGEVVDDGPDEIFVLSDGQPSAGEVQAPAAILAAIREANRYRRVRIHTVALGGGSAFLEQLARDHGGTYVAR